MNFDFNKNHFELFGLQPRFQIEQGRLEQAYRDIQTLVHPDRFTHLSDAERRASMQWATHANEAYQTLKKPVSRASYLLRLNGIETFGEISAAMPTDFLVSQMEWREAIMEAKAVRDVAALLHLETKLGKEVNDLRQRLAQMLDEEKNFQAAAEVVRKWRFLEKLQEEIGDALEQLES